MHGSIHKCVDQRGGVRGLSFEHADVAGLRFKWAPSPRPCRPSSFACQVLERLAETFGPPIVRQWWAAALQLKADLASHASEAPKNQTGPQ